MAKLMVGWLFILGSSYFLIHSIVDFFRARKSQRWPTTEAVMESVKLFGLRRVDGQMLDCLHIAIQYRYQIKGKEYQGDTPTFHTITYPDTLTFAERYPEGKAFRLHVDPNDPSASVVSPGLASKPYSDIILSVLGIAVGVMLLLIPEG